MKIVLAFCGTLAMLIGIVGIIIPGLPTTPFLLLSAALYMKSSQRLYSFLLSNRYLSPYILDFYSKKGLSIKTKIFSTALMWLLIIANCLFLIESAYLIGIVVFLGFVGTTTMWCFLPNSNK